VILVGGKTGEPFSGESDQELIKVTNIRVKNSAQGAVNFNWENNSKVGSSNNPQKQNGVFTIASDDNESPTGARLYFNTNKSSYQQGENLDLNVYLDTNDQQVKSVDLIFDYTTVESKLLFQTSSNPIQDIIISPDSGFNSNMVIKNFDTNSKKISVSLAYQNSNPVIGNNIQLGTVKLKVKNNAPLESVNLAVDQSSNVYDLQTQNILSERPSYTININQAGQTQPTSTPAPTSTTAPGQPTSTPAPTSTTAPSECHQEGEPCGTGFGGNSLGECCLGEGLTCIDSGNPDQGGTCVFQGSETPIPIDTVTLSLALKFQGIETQPANQANQEMKVKVGLTGTLLPEPVSKTTTVRADDKGVWYGTVDFSEIPPGSGYKVYIKGPKHLQKKVCDTQPTGDYYYHCRPGETITLTAGKNLLDFSKIYMMVGDIPENGAQDGVINSYDIAFIRNNLGKTDSQVLVIGDFNLDGIIDTQDYSLLIAAMAVRYDEE